jgi:hypothetical protein
MCASKDASKVSVIAHGWRMPPVLSVSMAGCAIAAMAPSKRFFGGVSDQVADMLKRCERGPSLARVTQVVIVDEGLSVDPGFTVRPTV